MLFIVFLNVILAYHIVYISLQESPVAVQYVIVWHVLYDLLYIRAFLGSTTFGCNRLKLILIFILLLIGSLTRHNRTDQRGYLAYD